MCELIKLTKKLKHQQEAFNWAYLFKQTELNPELEPNSDLILVDIIIGQQLVEMVLNKIVLDGLVEGPEGLGWVAKGVFRPWSKCPRQYRSPHPWVRSCGRSILCSRSPHLGYRSNSLSPKSVGSQHSWSTSCAISVTHYVLP